MRSIRVASPPLRQCCGAPGRGSLLCPPRIAASTQAEYRNEIFYPPYWYDDASKPGIEAINNNIYRESVVQLGYNETFNVTWSSQLTGDLGAVPVTGASFVAPSSVTHSYNPNQRVVRAEVVAVDRATGTLTLRTPPHPNVLPPQMLMLFLLNGKTYGSARWLQLVDTTGLASRPQR